MSGCKSTSSRILTSNCACIIFKASSVCLQELPRVVEQSLLIVWIVIVTYIQSNITCYILARSYILHLTILHLTILHLDYYFILLHLYISTSPLHSTLLSTIYYLLLYYIILYYNKNYNITTTIYIILLHNNNNNNNSNNNSNNNIWYIWYI